MIASKSRKSAPPSSAASAAASSGAANGAPSFWLAIALRWAGVSGNSAGTSPIRAAPASRSAA